MGGEPTLKESLDALESYFGSNTKNGTISSADMLKELTELLKYKYYFKPVSTYPLRSCSLGVVSTCDPSCGNTDLIEKCEEPTQNYTKLAKGAIYKNLYCAMCNGLMNGLINRKDFMWASRNRVVSR